MKAAFLAGCAATVGLACPVSAQEQTVNAYVRGMIASAADQDRALVGDVMIGEIAEGGRLEYTFIISPSKTYVVYGACDDDCSNIDLRGSDASGRQVDMDLDADDVPILLIERGASDDRLTVTLEMAACETEVCVTGVGLFETDF